MYPHWVAESLWGMRACWCRVRREDWQGFRSLEWKELEMKSWLWWKHSVFNLQFIFGGQWFQGALILGRNEWNFGPEVWAPKLVFNPQRLFQGHCHLHRQWQYLTEHSDKMCAKLLQTCFPGSASCWDHSKIHGFCWRAFSWISNVYFWPRISPVMLDLPFWGPAGGIRTWELGSSLRAPVSSSTGPNVSTGVDRVGMCSVRGALHPGVNYPGVNYPAQAHQPLLIPCPGEQHRHLERNPSWGFPMECSLLDRACWAFHTPHETCLVQSLSSSKGFCGCSRMLAAISCWEKGHNWSLHLEFWQGT